MTGDKASFELSYVRTGFCSGDPTLWFPYSPLVSFLVMPGRGLKTARALRQDFTTSPLCPLSSGRFPPVEGRAASTQGVGHGIGFGGILRTDRTGADTED